jgi:hypothetical protein
MAHTNRNFVIAYILLVGLPLLALAGVLRSGRSLKAPFSVDGAWKLDTGANHASAAGCGDLLSAMAATPLSISQSGTSLVINLGSGRTTTGTLDGKTIRAQFRGTANSSAAGCADHGLALAATLDPLTEPRSLSGKISIDGCDTCAPLEFRATRQSPPAAGGAH